MLIVEKGITNEMVQEKIRELKPIHPELAQVAETIHEMDLKKTVNTILARFGNLTESSCHARSTRKISY
jgi:hypothetical protein